MVDRFWTYSVAGFMALCVVSSDAHALFVDSFYGSTSQYLDENLTVSENGVFESLVGGIDVVRSVSIVNSGTIYSDFYVNDNVNLYVQNSGLIDGEFVLSPNAKLIQIVSGAGDLNFINVSSEYSLWVKDATDISLGAVLNISGGADKIVLENSVLNLSMGAPRVISDLSDNKFEVIGDVVILMESVDDVNYATPVLRNVSGDGTVSFDVTNINPLYRLASRIEDGDLYMALQRETDYRKVLGGTVGKFLDDLRVEYPNDNLLAKMDVASDMAGLESVMSRSVRLNPVRLMDVIRRMNMFDSFAGRRVAGLAEFDTGMDVIVSDTDAIYRGNISGAVAVTDDLLFGVNGFVGVQNTSDDINEFSARLFGGNISLRYDDGLVVGSGAAGLVYGIFDIGPVFDGGGTQYNPSGVAGYVNSDIGIRIADVFGFKLTPSVGVFADYADVVNDTDSLVLANAGLAINFAEHNFDILYDYGLRGNVMTDGAVHIGVFTEFYAPNDDIGGGLDFAIIHDDNGTAYKISATARIMF